MKFVRIKIEACNYFQYLNPAQHVIFLIIPQHDLHGAIAHGSGQP